MPKNYSGYFTIARIHRIPDHAHYAINRFFAAFKPFFTLLAHDYPRTLGKSDMLDYLFGSASYVPHGYCLLWRPDLVAMHVGGDMLTFMAYTAIALAIWRFTAHRPEYRYSPIALVSAAFVFGCGITHLVGMLTLWYPIYGIQGLLKLTVSGISITAAIVIWRMLPQILQYPSGAQIKHQYQLLSSEMEGRRRAEEEIKYRAEIESNLRIRETELSIALDRAKEADAAKDNFLAAMSHDLRTPLNAIIGFSEAMLTGIFGTFKSVKQEEYVDHIARSGRHLLTMIDDLLDFSNIHHGRVPHNPAPEDIIDILDETLAEVRVAQPEATIRMVAPEHKFDPELLIDSISIKRIVANLTVNAVKYAGNAGPITVRVVDSSDAVRILVEDCGSGFDTKDLHRLREPFTQGDSMSDGVGLGLSIVESLMRQHGGKLELGNRPEGGAVVSVVLPRTEARLPRFTEIAPAVPRKATTRDRVLSA